MPKIIVISFLSLRAPLLPSPPPTEEASLGPLQPCHLVLFICMKMSVYFHTNVYFTFLKTRIIMWLLSAILESPNGHFGVCLDIFCIVFLRLLNFLCFLQQTVNSICPPVWLRCGEENSFTLPSLCLSKFGSESIQINETFLIVNCYLHRRPRS